MSDLTPSPGMQALYGSLELHLLGTPPSFQIGDRKTLRCDVEAPGALVGRNAACDIRLTSPDKTVTGWVSNSHLVLTATPNGWLIHDVSRYGTTVRAPDRPRMHLRHGQPMPVVDGMVVLLPKAIEFQINVIHRTSDGTTTYEADDDGSGGLLRSPSAWISDTEQQELVRVLVQPFRDGDPDPRLNEEHVMAVLGWKQHRAQRVRRELVEHPAITPYLSGTTHITFVQLANAILKAFPSMRNPPLTP